MHGAGSDRPMKWSGATKPGWLLDKSAPGLCGCGVADVDSDGDETPDCFDACPEDPTKRSRGLCGCGHAGGGSRRADEAVAARRATELEGQGARIS